MLRDAFLDVGVELESQCFALFGRFREVHHFGAFGFGHCWRLVSREKMLLGGLGGGVGLWEDISDLF